MSKDTREFIHNKGGASLRDGVELQRDKLNVNAIAYTQAADSEGTIERFFREQSAIEIIIRRFESHHQETGEPISKDDAVALAKCIKDLHLCHPFDGRAHYIAVLAGKCLTLKEGQAAGEVFTAMVMLKAKNPPPAFPERRGPALERIINLAVPAELFPNIAVPAEPCPERAAFGVESFSWLQSRSEDFARDYARKGCKPGSPASRWFDGGDIGFLPDRECLSQPEPGSIPVVLAPDETNIAEYVKRAPSKADYWDALVKVAAILREHRQPFGDALQVWLIEAAGRNTPRPKGTTPAKWPAGVLRNHAIIEAVRALERCGMQATRNRDENWIVRAHGWKGKREPDYSPPLSGCALVASAFGITERTAISVWDSRTKAM